MSVAKLRDALSAVDWSRNLADFSRNDALAERTAALGVKLAVWARQFETVDKGNPATCFVKEMQLAAQNVALLIALGLYKPAAASMRAVVETALYYTYFRQHPQELATLVRNSGYYVSKSEIVEFHKLHCAGFWGRQTKLSLLGRLDTWYSKVSAVVHGQVPGAWSSYTSIREVKHNPRSSELAVATFEEGEEIVRLFLLCTVAQDMWNSFSSTAKSSLLSGLKGEHKSVIGLDNA